MKRTGFAFYFFYFAANACILPYLALYYQKLGFSGTQIGLLTAIGPLISLVGAPFWTGLADTSRRHRVIMSFSIAATAGLVIVLSTLQSLPWIMLTVAMMSFFSSPIASLADSAVIHMLGQQQELYGQTRLGGTFGWGLAAPLTGTLVQRYDLRLVFFGFSLLISLAMLISLRFSYPVHPQARSADRGQSSAAIKQLASDKRWRFFLVMAFMCGLGFASINNYLFPYMQSIGASQPLMGIALTIATASEVPVMFLSNRLLKTLGPLRLLFVGMMVTTVRLLLYAFFPTPAGVLAFQLLDGMTFACVWVAGVSYASQIAPTGLKATAQGLFGAAVFGFGAAGGGFLGGYLLGSLGAQTMYLIMGSILLAGLVTFLLVQRNQLRPVPS